MIGLRMLALIAVLGPAVVRADDHVVAQKDKAFSATKITAKVGDTITFKNEDAFVHNIFSLSEIQSFDLGTFGHGETRQVRIASKGTIEIECAVHPEMKLVVDVTD